MSIKKQEEEVKLLTETCKTLFTFFLTLSGGLAFILRTTYSVKSGMSSSTIDGILLLVGVAVDSVVIVYIIKTWFKIKKVIKTL